MRAFTCRWGRTWVGAEHGTLQWTAVDYLQCIVKSSDSDVRSYAYATDALEALDAWAPSDSNGQDCPSRNIIHTVSAALDTAELGCLITIITSGMTSGLTPAKETELTARIQSMKCHVRRAYAFILQQHEAPPLRPFPAPVWITEHRLGLR